jgi:hypothetical protein
MRLHAECFKSLLTDKVTSLRQHQFNSFWYGNGLSPVEWVCLSSFIEHGHRVRLFCYDPVIVPPGVTIEDASPIISRSELFLFNGSVSAFSNLFRYKLMVLYGEWWIDTDVYCLKDDIPECRYAWANEDIDRINGAVLKLPANEPVLDEICRAAYEIGRNLKVWGELGPHLLTKHLMGRRFDDDHFGSRGDFYPIHYLETFLFWLRDNNDVVQNKCREAWFIHLWTSVIPQMGIDCTKKPPSGSFLERIYIPHMDRFQLQELSTKEYDRTIERMRSYCIQEWVVNSSIRRIGYDVSKFNFERFITRGHLNK